MVLEGGERECVRERERQKERGKCFGIVKLISA